MAPPSRSRFYEKLSKKKQDGTIDNLSNTFNPCFYRGIHLETARRLTPISQGGYLPLNQGNVPEDEICQQEKVEEQPTEEKSLRYIHHKEFHLHLWGRDTVLILTNATLFCKNDSKLSKGKLQSFTVCLKTLKNIHSLLFFFKSLLFPESIICWYIQPCFFLEKRHIVFYAKKDVTLSFLMLPDRKIPLGSFESMKMVNHWHTYIKEPFDDF